MSSILKTRTFKATLFGILLIPLQICGGLLLGFANKKFNLNLSMVSSLIVSQLGFLLLPVIIYFILTKEPVRKTLKLNSISLPNILRILAITILIQPLIMAIAGLGSLFFPNYLVEFTSEINKNVSFPVLIVLTALFPALFEELCTRGIIFSGYRDKKLWVAASVNGLLFAILHMNVQQGLYAFVLGYIFVYLVDAADSIFASIISHFVINASQMTLLHFTAGVLAQEGQSIANAQAETPKEALVFSIVLLLGIGIFFALLAYFPYRGIKRSTGLLGPVDKKTIHF